MFENGVILYGNQTKGTGKELAKEFENGVILYGNQTMSSNCAF